MMASYPFKVKQIATTIDEYVYTSDDVIQGEVEQARRYRETDFNTIIEIEEREKREGRIFLNDWIRLKSPWFFMQIRTMHFCEGPD